MTVGYGVGSSLHHIGPEYGFSFAMDDAMQEEILIIKWACEQYPAAFGFVAVCPSSVAFLLISKQTEARLSLAIGDPPVRP
eukprot:SAG31_NODE_3913_length_3756_cov_1.959256_4_plen_81_part_00